MFFLSHKSYLKTEYFLQISYSTATASCWVEKSKFVSLREKSLAAYVYIEQPSQYKFAVFPFARFLKKYFGFLHLCERFVKENSINKTRTEFAPLCDSVLRKPFIINSETLEAVLLSVHAQFKSNAANVKTISYKLECAIFSERKLNFLRKCLLLLDFWWWEEKSEPALPFAETIYIYFPQHKWWQHFFFTVISQEEPFH